MLSDETRDILLRAFPFMDKLQDGEADLILASSVMATYKQDEGIHNGGIDCVGVLVVKSGCLRTYLLSEKGREVTLFRLDPGEVCVLSASCIIKNITFEVHIDAIVDSEVILVNLDAINRITQNVYVENFMLNEAMSRFSDVVWTMEQILFRKFDERLAIFLLDEVSRTSDDIIDLTHDQMARHLGSAREVVSRMLKYFAQEGLVGLSRGKVQVTNKDGLRSIIGMGNPQR